jgi:hypothetical protein
MELLITRIMMVNTKITMFKKIKLRLKKLFESKLKLRVAYLWQKEISNEQRISELEKLFENYKITNT